MASVVEELNSLFCFHSFHIPQVATILDCITLDSFFFYSQCLFKVLCGIRENLTHWSLLSPHPTLFQIFLSLNFFINMCHLYILMWFGVTFQHMYTARADQIHLPVPDQRDKYLMFSLMWKLRSGPEFRTVISRAPLLLPRMLPQALEMASPHFISFSLPLSFHICCSFWPGKVSF